MQRGRDGIQARAPTRCAENWCASRPHAGRRGAPLRRVPSPVPALQRATPSNVTVSGPSRFSAFQHRHVSLQCDSVRRLRRCCLAARRESSATATELQPCSARHLVARFRPRASTPQTGFSGLTRRPCATLRSLPRICHGCFRANPAGIECRSCQARGCARVRVVRWPYRSFAGATRAGPSWPNRQVQSRQVA